MTISTHRVLDKYEWVEFQGELLASTSTETPEATRWIELEIYRTTTGRYVIHRVGRSVLYHVHGGTCNTGVTKPASQLDRELAQPCPRCSPATVAKLGHYPATLVDVELDKDRVDTCDAAGVYATLQLKRRDPTTGEEYSFLSQPARRALEEAMEHDLELRDQVINHRAVRRVI